MKVKISCTKCSEQNFIQLEKTIISEQDFEGLLLASGHIDEECVLVADLYNDYDVVVYSKIKSTEPPLEEEPPTEETPTKPWWQFW